MSLPVSVLITYPGFVLFNYKINGRRVTIPEPRGNISLPQMASKTDDLTADYEPTTTIYGKSIVYYSVETVANTSYNELMIGIKVSVTVIWKNLKNIKFYN